MNKVLLGAFGLAIILVACPGPGVDPIKVNPPTDTVKEAPIVSTGTLGSLNELIAGGRALETRPQATANTLQARFESVSKDVEPKVFYTLPASAQIFPMQLIKAIQSGSIAALKPQATGTSQQILPRGAYDCTNVTAANPNCVKTASDDYSIKFTNKSNTMVQVMVDWNGSESGAPSATQTVSYNSYGTLIETELPTKASFYLQIGTVKIVEASATASWDKATIKTFFGGNPTTEVFGLVNGSFKGIAQTVSGAKIIIVRGIDYGFNSTSKEISTTGDVSVIDGDTFRARWDFKVGMTTDANSYTSVPLIGVMGYKPNGTSSVKASLEINADVYAFQFDTSNLIESPFAISVANGLLFQKGKTAAFAGTINDSNKNCIPGENFNVTTTAGTQNLEKILIDNFSVAAGSC
jgi:hypothetical protein